MLGYLAYFRHVDHPREHLIDLLWPEDDLESGRHKLSVALSSLRQQLEPQDVPDGFILQASRSTVRLNPEATQTDVEEFQTTLASALQDISSGKAECVERLAHAVDLYRGELLAGYYEDWIPREQQRLADRLVVALRTLTAHYKQAGDPARAIEYARRVVSIDRLSDEAHAELMRLYTATGQRSAALRQYREFARLLDEELGAEPSESVRSLLQEIERAPAAPGPLPAADAGLEVYQTGAHYHLIHALAILVTALLAGRGASRRMAEWAGWLFFAGIVLFSGSLYALAVSGIRILGAITPLGGVCFLTAWALLGISAWQRPLSKDHG
jgi:uncharacterized membrane protein YgdD (TMEM256/DUF423 family)/DNA-binding SARP family transcriptional activator